MIRSKASRMMAKKMKKQFKSKMDGMREDVKAERFEEARSKIIKSLTQGTELSENAIDAADTSDEEVNKAMKKIDEVEHEPTKEFMKEIRTLPETKQAFNDYINRFEDYYISSLNDKYDLRGE